MASKFGGYAGKVIIKPGDGMKMVCRQYSFTHQTVNNVSYKYIRLNATVRSENVASQQLHDARISKFIPCVQP